MAKKEQKFKRYSIEIKEEAVRLHEKEGMSSREIAKQLGVRNKTQVNCWVERHRKGELFSSIRKESTAWRKGRPKTNFSSIEEELAYVKAERDYLKKRYPNLHGEVCQRKQDSK